MQSGIYSGTIINQNAAQDFFAQHENYCIALTQKWHTAPQDVYFIAGQNISGSLSVSEGGLILHHFTEFSAETEALLQDFFVTRKVFCTSGSQLGALFLQKLFLQSKGMKPAEERPMHLMQTHDAPQARILPDGLSIRQCSLADFDRLLPLQKGFYIEEVLPANHPFNMLSCRLNLHNDLEKKTLFAIADKSGKLLAKISETAESEHCTLIGGVYTLPEFRRRGLSRALCSWLVHKNAQKGKSCVLFVKEDNTPAIATYMQSGFKIISSYEIDYW